MALDLEIGHPIIPGEAKKHHTYSPLTVYNQNRYLGTVRGQLKAVIPFLVHHGVDGEAVVHVDKQTL